MAEKSTGESPKREEAVKKPQIQFSYRGQYPGMPEFEKPWEFCIQVGQGRGKLSLDKKPLQSEGFSKCSGLVLKNETSGASALFHIDDFDLRGEQTPVIQDFIANYIESLDMNPEKKSSLLLAARDVAKYMYPKTMRREVFQQRMEELNRDGVLKAQYVAGSDSRNIKDRIMRSLLSYLGIKAVNDIVVDTGEHHWALVYKPKEAQVLVDVRRDKKVLVYDF